MGTRASTRTSRSDPGRSKERIFRVDYCDMEMERRGIEEEIRQINKKLLRLRDYEQALIDSDCADEWWLVERIRIKRDETRRRLSQLRKIHERYESVMEVMRFAKSDWCQFLLLGNKLSPSDIINEWTREARKLWDETGGKKLHPGYKITEETIREILALHDAGMKRKDIALRLGISTYPVGRYIRERSNE